MPQNVLIKMVSKVFFFLLLELKKEKKRKRSNWPNNFWIEEN